jgi:succinate dehydrogenase / fumarate reductase, cytochrome b subunit
VPTSILSAHAEDRAAKRALAWRRLHSALGLLPLGAYLFFHAWEHWPVRLGRDALFLRLSGSASTALELTFVLLPLLVHGALGLSLSRDPAGAAAYRSASFRRLQIASGALSGAFLLFHLLTAWLPRLAPATLVMQLAAVYSAMLDWTGTGLFAVLHAVGLAAVCTHFGQGVGLALPRLLPRLVAPRLGRWVGIGLAAALWLIFLNELAAYATYAPLL